MQIISGRCDGPRHQCADDFLYTMEALTNGQAIRLWRNSIKASWDNCCAYCGKPPIDDESLTLDHVKAKSRGGEDLTSNIVPADLPCNASKGSEDWREWYRRQDFYDPRREARIQYWQETSEVLPLEYFDDSPS